MYIHTVHAPYNLAFLNPSAASLTNERGITESPVHTSDQINEIQSDNAPSVTAYLPFFFLYVRIISVNVRPIQQTNQPVS
ncbi:Uncharacterized protein APZ42_018295 [Daphnia magna]|uniref:Uncharacterized protein n=1 Tax=Daphnia magna TaxID=35525 RepID=A0A164Z7K8_9CRUS|nr:Uncharacterized protein APZ42_018295 [Daphnia magna]